MAERYSSLDFVVEHMAWSRRSSDSMVVRMPSVPRNPLELNGEPLPIFGKWC